ncbi:MMPL family transporter [Mycolicibacterium mageritense]|uniref:Membrane protein n=1 Tax=Mycolicibacterium mageritense TaxID=53462 RepID=A0ABM7HUN2_MYCME|nr:MMPL family transporter [Mycolicibacterium mageritense]MCC9181827.1 MMPL family transporter [Mycolicibacterium mageritense]BBX34292.1 membrane protein [Mycolicibacterium mageritense]CDO21186.1 antibiotic transporter [Mycolicibacterium mageritense DSM 44476 = CIP 104973]
MIRRLAWLAALVVVVSGALLALLGSDDSGSRSPVAVPPGAESARAEALRSEFPGGDRAPAILVVTRADGTELSAADIDATVEARQRMTDEAGPPVLVSDDGKAALATVPVDTGLSGFALDDAVQGLRGAAAQSLPAGLRAEVTGGPAFGADIANSFAGANITLLAVTATVVALLLIVTYRSPVLWLVPLLVIGFADRVGAVVGTAAASGLGLSPDGSTAGITSVLVFGAGTNYALLLISRYREELGRTGQHREALQIALRAAGPAIVASNATVVLALLTLLFATAPSNRSLGVQAAAGLIVAAIFVLVVLPPLLALCGTRLFWPFIPKPGAQALTDNGVWHRIADAVARRPGRVTIGSVAVLALLCTGLAATPIGLSQTEQFRVQAESVTGYQTLAAHFPSGLTNPTTVIASSAKAAGVQRAITDTAGVVSATSAGESPTGLSQFSVVLKAAPASAESFEIVDALRDSIRTADRSALVGGPDAQARDAAAAAQRDRTVVIPAILAVVLAVLYVLLRSALAPVLLVAVTVLSALAALGLGGWAGVHVFGFPALDNSTPLFAFLFLVALGVDYTIFLLTRAREETPEHGTRQGIVRAVSATGAVITCAGVVLAAVFCVLGVLPLIVLTQLGIIVGLGILLDTFVVRTVIIPALFTLIGPRIWWPGLRADP